MEIESVRLISSGASASVTAHSTYFSGGSVIIDGMCGITLATDALAGGKSDMLPSDPFTAYLTATRLEDIHAFAIGADVQLFKGRRVLTVPFKDRPRHLEESAAIFADQHSGSSSRTSIYYPQSQP